VDLDDDEDEDEDEDEDDDEDLDEDLDEDEDKDKDLGEGEDDDEDEYGGSSMGLGAAEGAGAGAGAGAAEPEREDALLAAGLRTAEEAVWPETSDAEAIEDVGEFSNVKSTAVMRRNPSILIASIVTVNPPRAVSHSPAFLPR
jgi:hypothetical protein